MKAKTVMVCLVAVCLWVSLFAQSQEKELFLKIYSTIESSNFRMTNGNDTLITEDKGNSFSFSSFSPAIAWVNENGNFHEIALSKLIFRRDDEVFLVNNVPNNTVEPISGANTSHFGFALRYEYNWSLSKKSNRLNPKLGFSNLILVDAINSTPKTSIGFPSKSLRLANRIGVTPRLLLNLSKKFVIDFNLSIPLLELSLERVNEENPILPSNQQVQSDSDLGFLPKIYQFRIGVGIKV